MISSLLSRCVTENNGYVPPFIGANSFNNASFIVVPCSSKSFILRKITGITTILIEERT